MKLCFSLKGIRVAGLSLLCLAWPELPLADAPQRYGSFRYDDAVPHTLFLTGEIAQGDSFELRRALREYLFRRGKTPGAWETGCAPVLFQRARALCHPKARGDHNHRAVHDLRHHWNHE